MIYWLSAASGGLVPKSGGTNYLYEQYVL